MFRRRPRTRRPLLRRRPRRPLGPRGAPPRRPPLPPRIKQALARANRLMANSQFGEAAAIFADLDRSKE